MQTQAPTITRILIAVGFVLSCFGLALFLWLAFGGPIPLKPEGYRFTVPFQEATQLAQESDVRISGVSVGKVKAIEQSEDGAAEATIELEADYAPIPSDTRAVLRQKTLLGETFVELTPGTEDGEPRLGITEGAGGAEALPEGGSLPAAQVAGSVQLDEIFRAFDEPTRNAFRAWMQGQAASFRGRGDDVSVAIASLEPFAEEADRALRILDSQSRATQQLVRDGGEVFEALSERRGQLRGLIENSNEVFATTAARDLELIETFRIFPTFLRESRATLTRLDRFAQDTDPLMIQLRPVARELTPTLIDLGRLAPDLEAFFAGFGETIEAGKDGLPATKKLLRKDLPPLLDRLDPYLADFNSIFEGLGLYRREITALLGNVSAATLNSQALEPDGDRLRNLRVVSPLGPEALSAYPHRLKVNRTNPYVEPGGYSGLPIDGFEVRHCPGGLLEGITADLPDPQPVGPFNGGTQAFPENLYENFRRFAWALPAASTDGTDDPSDGIPTSPCTEQAPLQSIGIAPETSKYIHVREQP
jgi:virulence factor Mce-like protein